MPQPRDVLPPEPGLPEPAGDSLVESRFVGIPEFVPAWVRLTDACGDDPGESLSLMELADFVQARLRADTTDRSVADRALSAIESHLASIAGDRIGCELIAFAFFDRLAPNARRLPGPSMGVRSRALVEELDGSDTWWETSS